ncbi:MAG TPA: zinc ribbon domain-containing protein [Pirellulales bacterium]|nr:zinc ribbon domain-containing protein [Pirellulales bacterium]
MPYYEYKCAKCGATFTVMRSMAEQERLGQIKCPECASKQVVRVYSPVLVRTSKKA